MSNFKKKVVGNLPKIKADQYLNDVMNKFRNDMKLSI